ncbi:MAG: murein hydrolase activator EnvC family protein [Betaproteobacteria bacterium]
MSPALLARASSFLIFVLLSAVAHAAGSTASAADARNELKALRAKIEALQKQLQDAEGSRTEAADALKASERAISDANRRLHELTAQSQALNRELDELRRSVRENESALQQQQAHLEHLLYQQYIAGRSEPFRLLLNGEDPNRIARQLYYYGHMTRARAAAIDGVRKGLAQLRALAEESQRKSGELAALTVEQASQKRRLEEEKKARVEVLARLSRDIRNQQSEIGTLKRNEARLTRLIEQLGKIVTRKPPPPRARNERLPDSSVGSGPFEALRGRLRLPVRGELRNRFGSPRPEGGVTWKGLFIAAKAGDEVRAVAGGRVVYADWLRGFGNLLIIDHGEAYMTLYGYNETLYKRVGDSIRGGDPIAAVGNSGGNADSGLYFELRHEGRPLDPLRWVEHQ